MIILHLGHLMLWGKKKKMRELKLDLDKVCRNKLQKLNVGGKILLKLVKTNQMLKL